jgi:hypothetical protein
MGAKKPLIGYMTIQSKQKNCDQELPIFKRNEYQLNMVKLITSNPK